jgi:hypothetical protein
MTTVYLAPDTAGGQTYLAPDTAAATGSAPGATLVGTSTIAGGAASAAGSAPGAALVGTSTIAGGIASISGTSSGAITVPSSRTAVFGSGSRVIPFGSESNAPTVGPGPYYRNGHWTVDKVAADKLYYVGDISLELAASGTTAASVTATAVGATVLVAPSLQGNLIVIKVGQLDTSANAVNYVTLRVVCANGEQFDRTIYFNLASGGTWTFQKDPDDQRFYAFDISADLRFSSSTLASAAAPTVAGVASLVSPVIQGNLAIVKLGGLDVSGSPVNSCLLSLTFASGEQIYRTIYFTRMDN